MDPAAQFAVQSWALQIKSECGLIDKITALALNNRLELRQLVSQSRNRNLYDSQSQVCAYYFLLNSAVTAIKQEMDQ